MHDCNTVNELPNGALKTFATFPQTPSEAGLNGVAVEENGRHASGRRRRGGKDPPEPGLHSQPAGLQC